MTQGNVWDKKRKAQEDQHFEDENRRAIERLLAKKQGKISPVSGQALKEITFRGIRVDFCPHSGGIWLDAGELEKLAQSSVQDASAAGEKPWPAGLLGMLREKLPK